MATFKGTFWDRRAAFHTVYADNKKGDYHKIGMRDSNCFNWDRAGQNEKFRDLCWDNDLNPYETPISHVYDYAGDEGNVMFILREWDKDLGEYVDTEMTPQDVEIAARYWEKKNTLTEEEFAEHQRDENDELIDRFLLSIQKCAIYNSNDLNVYVYLLEQSGDNQPNVSNTRLITGDGGLMITDTPARPTGGVYSSQDSTDNEMNGSMGNYFPVKGKPKAKDKVTGKVRLSYDRNSETWGVQNQVLAQLIEPLEPAEAPVIDLAEYKDLVNEDDNKEFYSTSGDKYVGAFKTAEAVVLSKEGNNPNMFGPNMLNPCSDQMKMEVIRVVNRTSKSYKKNQLVMCHLIDNEWIATEFGKDPAEGGDGSTATKVGRWEFSKFFCNWDTYFTMGLEGTDQRTPINPETLKRSVRYRTYGAYEANGTFYSDREFQNGYSVADMIALNKPSEDAGQAQAGDYLFNQPYQLTDFDQLGPELGGVSSISYIGRTNLYYDAQGQEGASQEYYTFEYATYWGAVFPDGFKSRDYGRVKNNPGVLAVRKFNSYGSQGYLSYVQTGALIASAFNNAPNSYSDGEPSTNGMFTRGSLDPNVRNLPASVGLNGRWGEYTSPLVCYQEVFTGVVLNGDLRPLMESLSDSAMTTGSRILTTDSFEGSNAFGMEPVNPKKITFTSLTAEMAGHTDPFALLTNTRYDRDFFTDYRDILSGNGTGGGLQDDSAFGKAPERAIEKGTPGSYGVLSSQGTTLNIYDQGVQFPSTVQNGIVTYDCYNYYIGGEPIGSLTTPFYEDDDVGNSLGAGMCGVQGARNVISKNAGGVITIDCECSYGINGDWLGGSSGGSTLSIIMGVAFGTSSQATRGNLTPGWGSTDADDINSFGTTALHVKVYDYWPEASTYYLPTYHTVFHFNPGIAGSTPSRKEGVFRVSNPGTPNARTNYNDVLDDLDLESEKVQSQFEDGTYQYFYYDDTSDVEEFNTAEVAEYIREKVDFVVPTFGFNDPSGGVDGESVPLGTEFVADTEWRRDDKSNILTGNRGMMLSGADDDDVQFLFPRRTGGFSNSAIEIIDAGSGYVEDQILAGTFGSQWKVTSVNAEELGTVQGIEIYDYTDPILNRVQPGNGEGVTPRDIGDDGYVMTFDGGLKIKIRTGIIVERIDRLYGPKLRVPTTRLSAPSRDGRQTVFETKSTTINLDRNNGGGDEFELENPFAGRYEFFYLYHNDISHTFALTKGSNAGNNPPITQYITMTIN